MRNSILLVFFLFLKHDVTAQDSLARANARLDRNELESARLDYSRLSQSPDSSPDLVAECQSRIIYSWLRQNEPQSAVAYVERVVLPKYEQLYPQLSRERRKALGAWVAYAYAYGQKAEKARNWLAEVQIPKEEGMNFELASTLSHAYAALGEYQTADRLAGIALEQLSGTADGIPAVAAGLLLRADIARLAGDRKNTKKFVIAAWDHAKRNREAIPPFFFHALCKALAEDAGKEFHSTVKTECQAVMFPPSRAQTVEVLGLIPR
ncbi:MAG: hypothetical protein NW208_00650 [Bryobacter sp.]|nr:hypothetical protein [Bryobacter sp.]